LDRGRSSVIGSPNEKVLPAVPVSGVRVVVTVTCSLSVIDERLGNPKPMSNSRPASPISSTSGGPEVVEQIVKPAVHVKVTNLPV